MKEFSKQQYLTWVTRLHDLILTALDNLTSDKAGKAIPAGPEGFWR